MKWVTGTTESSYGCGARIINPLMLPKDQFCVVHSHLRQINDSVTGFPKITLKNFKVHFNS